ncbi:30S ribosomal protein S24e [Geoglobus acetivorans]|uniref:Small ribosomal subunit protein eS24 n=1 Tax=Geoglobus acetivorans TaxID=565033 RepID=A0A0A7GD47_GEOAI|nr:SSU ribosomal protein S24e [Geoglobus acetivorans]MBE8539483.1 30S ribosomal protein S24e [Geoglobus acetivorans]
MELVIEKQRNNPLLKRKEVYFRVKYEDTKVTPSRKEVREKLSGLLNANLDSLIVRWMKPEFGKMEAEGYALIYESPDDMKAIEEDYILKRNFGEPEEGE